ncbi:MAG: hypothetical protein ACLQUY_16770 [Ktedonobacterales bacterium]
MPSFFARVLLFLSSYAPLAAMLVLLFWTKSPIVTIISGAAFVIGIGGMLIYLGISESFEGEPTKILDCHGRGEAAASYIVAYIVPFLAFAFSEWQQAAALAVFFVILGFLYVNSDMHHINPTLNFFGYRLYEVTIEGGSVYSLLARGRIQKGSTLSLVRIGDEILLEKRRRSS